MLIESSERVSRLITQLVNENRALDVDATTAETTLAALKKRAGAVNEPDSPTKIFTSMNKLATVVSKGGDVRRAVNDVVVHYKPEWQVYMRYFLSRIVKDPEFMDPPPQ